MTIRIQATPEKVWALLTDAEQFPKWNGTVLNIDGAILQGQKIKVLSTSSPKRVFSLMVSEMVPSKKMVWSAGNFLFKGVRTFSLTPTAEQSTSVTMHEIFTGLMLPFIGRTLPDFRPFFEQFAQDLKCAAERS